MDPGVARVLSGTPQGVEAVLVDVEVDLLAQLPSISTVGLAQAAVKEAKDRVRSAIGNTGFSFPRRRVTVNLAPARIPKEGTAFDLPIGVGILAANGKVARGLLGQYVLMGELSLDGAVRCVPGVLSVAMAAQEAGLQGILVPEGNVSEASAVEGIDTVGVRSLKEAVDFLNGELSIAPALFNREAALAPVKDAEDPFQEIIGQECAKRAMEVAAAGHHNLLMVGPPGAGKTLLARSFPSILPAPSTSEALEVTRIYSVSGLLKPGQGLISTRPVRAPHHTTSAVTLIGGGSKPRPGEITLAHHGVLFLDELPEFPRASLEALRQPLEDRYVVVARSRQTLVYPASFLFVAAMNPCPCGYALGGGPPCECAEENVRRYRGRLSGPLLDRIDLQVEVPAVSWKELQSGDVQPEKTEEIRKRVNQARRTQGERYKDCSWEANAMIPGSQVSKFCAMGKEAKELLGQMGTGGTLSARAYHRILRVARTLADLAQEPSVLAPHLLEAFSFRCS